MVNKGRSENIGRCVRLRIGQDRGANRRSRNEPRGENHVDKMEEQQYNYDKGACESKIWLEGDEGLLVRGRELLKLSRVSEREKSMP